MTTGKTTTGKGEILMLLGGVYHDFDRFAQVMTPVFHSHGYTVTATDDLEALNRLADANPGAAATASNQPAQGEVAAVLMYTCLGGREPLPAGQAAALDTLADWVEAGGRFLAAHAATVTGKHHPHFAQMAGGYFIEHPPQFSFQVTPLGRAHPMTEGITAFTVFDEFYIQSYEADVEIHLVAADRGVAYPMAWSRTCGAGRVANVALGHSERVWQTDPYQRLMLQAMQWLTA